MSTTFVFTAKDFSIILASNAKNWAAEAPIYELRITNYELRITIWEIPRRPAQFSGAGAQGNFQEWA